MQPPLLFQSNALLLSHTHLNHKYKVYLQEEELGKLKLLSLSLVVANTQKDMIYLAH